MEVLRDLFVGNNGTHLAAHTPDIGGPWTDTVPGWQIESNKAQQMVDSADSRVPCAIKLGQCSFNFNVNGIDAGNSLYFLLGDIPNAVGYGITIGSTGLAQANVQAASGGDYFDWNNGHAPILLDPTVDHFCQIYLGPQRFRCLFDGQVVCDSPRGWPANVAPAKFIIQGGALNAHPGPKLWNLRVATP